MRSARFIWLQVLCLVILGILQSSRSQAEVAKIEGPVSNERTLTEKTLREKTLKDAFEAAVARSEAVEVQHELLVQAQEVGTQASGALFPTVAGSFTRLHQPSPSSSTGNTIFPTDQTTTKITLTQPLFRGLRDFAALRQKKVQVGSQYEALLLASRQLFYDVSTAFYTVLTLQKDVQNYLLEIEVNYKRLGELEAFVKIGRSQLTDVLAFKANIAAVEAQLEATRGQYETAKDVLAYLTGWKRDFALRNDESLPKKLGDVESYLVKIEDRPEVKVAFQNSKASDEGVSIAFGGHYPSIDFIGNYYLSRPGVLSDVNWDISLALTLPIFQGGVVQSQVRQARSVLRQSHLQLSQSRRLAEEEIRTFYNAARADTSQVAKLTELVEISKQNADTTIKYYRNGLVTNLEVLQAISTHHQSKRQLDHQSFATYLDCVKLQAASGQRNEIYVRAKAEEP